MRTITATIATIGRTAFWCAVFGLGAGFLASVCMVIYGFAGTPGVVLFLALCIIFGWSQSASQKKPEAPAGATPAPAQAQPPFAPPFVPTWRQEQPLPLDPSWHLAPPADPYVQAYIREYGRFPPMHHGHAPIIPGNLLKDSGASGDNS